MNIRKKKIATIKVICPQCGNNSCNGHFGCELCPDVYAWVELQYADHNYPKTKEEIEIFNKRELL